MNLIKEALKQLDNMEPVIARTKHSLAARLDEDLKGYFKNQYLKKFIERMMQGSHAADFRKARTDKEKADIAYNLMLALAKLDPTFKGKDDENPEDALKKNPGSYFDWLMRLVNKGAADYDEIMRDAHEYVDQLEIFNDLKKRNRLPSDKKDIMQFKNLDELMTFIQETATTTVDGKQVEASLFKNDIKDIRKLLQDMDCPEIPESIKSWEDVLEYIGESENWEVWSPKNKQGAYILDQWGKGAGWCVGGSGYKGNQATTMWRYFNNYIQGDEKYVCFQNKNKNAERPTNKYLITLGARGGKPATSSGYQFNDANNHTQRDENFNTGEDRWSSSSNQDDQMAALAKFLDEAGLTQVMKDAGFTELRALAITENIERLKNGEPYLYTSGKVPKVYRDSIKQMEYTFDGKTYTIDVEGHPEYFDAESISELVNLQRLNNGEAYIFDGTLIKDLFRPLIKKVVFSENYDFKVLTTNPKTNERTQVVGIRFNTFANCVNMEECQVPATVVYIQANAFKNCDKAKIIIPRYPDRPLINAPGDSQYLYDHLYYDDGDYALHPSKKKTDK